MEYVEERFGGEIVLRLVDVICKNAAYLSEIDGATGDGDHGVNMKKGFLLAKERMDAGMNLAEAFKVLGRTLLMDIGGSMGPIYGTLFSQFSKAFDGNKRITPEVLSAALENAAAKLMDLAGAKPGDKTLLDTLCPATAAYKEAMAAGEDFALCLGALSRGAEEGKESTKAMAAKIGRAARLGERSRGVLDAGATSCCLILQAMAEAMQEKLARGDR